MAKAPYYGETGCEATCKNGRACSNKAYWEETSPLDGRPIYLCGVHARDKIDRWPLSRNPNAGEDRKHNIEEFARDADYAATENRRQNQRGTVICYKMGMRRKVVQRAGFKLVFPNAKHQNRKDGYGCSSLSPMSLGPVDHGQPGLPEASCIENFHQFGKVFADEIYDDDDRDPTPKFFEAQRKGYLDPVPHRHKRKGEIPEYSAWLRQDGTLIQCGYIESRQFYCTFYARLTAGNADLAHLKGLLNQGYNLQICGYDANPRLTPQNVDQWYLDSSAPFGHESVLFALLTVPEADWPWITHRTEVF